MHGYTHFYHDPKFWVAAAFVIFILLAAKYIWPKIAKGLDGRSAAIRDQLEQAHEALMKEPKSAG